MSTPPLPDFERVYTMTDYYDGPRGGIASFNGKPHAYASLFDTSEEDYSDTFELRPVDDETLRLALEDWEIWIRWQDAYRAGLVSIESHPALPTDRERHDEITPILVARLEALSGPVVRARAIFRPTPGHADAEGGRWLEAQWTPAD
jgi:hypothetical protein